MRPYLLYVSGIAGLVGLAVAPNPRPLHIVAAMVWFFSAYGLGQALTDVFQVDTDAISASYRPLVRGEVSRKAVFWVSIVGLLAVAAPLAVIDFRLVVMVAIAGLGLILYTPFKRRWWGGPPWNSWLVAMVPVMGYIAGNPHVDVLGEAPLQLWWTVAAVFCAYANFVVGGYFKDISADSQTQYQTIQVRFGWFAGAVCSDVLAALSVAFTALAIGYPGAGGAPGSKLALAVMVVGAACNLRAQIQLHRTRDEAATGAPIATIVRSFILYCSAIAVACKPQWFGYLVVYYALFELTLRMRPRESQV